MSYLLVFIFSVAIALLVSASCSLMESILLSLSPSQIADISDKKPSMGRLWNRFKSDINTPISAILILNTTAHTIGAAVAGAAFDHLFGSRWMWFFSITFTYAMLQFTEILPKSLGVKYNRQLAGIIARPLYFMGLCLSPVIFFLRWVNHFFEPKGLPVQQPPTAVDELRFVARMARDANQIDAKQAEIIRGAAALSKKTARDIMIPLSEVSMLSTDITIQEVIDMAKFDAHTRFPVCKGRDRNQIIGYVNTKELMPLIDRQPDRENWATDFSEVIRPVPCVDVDAPALRLMALFTSQHEHIAMIFDEVETPSGSDEISGVHGKVCLGLATLEDIVEELIGEINDEFDQLPRSLYDSPTHTLIVGGGYPMHDLQRYIVENFYTGETRENFIPLSTGDDFKNLAYWLQNQLGGIPKAQDKVVVNGFEFTVRRVRRRKVFDVQIRKLLDNSEEK